MVPTLPSSPARLSLTHCATLWVLFGYAHALERPSYWLGFINLLIDDDTANWNNSDELRAETVEWFRACRNKDASLLQTMQALYVECTNRHVIAVVKAALKDLHDQRQQTDV